MRWILTLVALAAGAWFFTNRRRRAQLQERVQNFTPPVVQDQVRNAASTVTDFAAGAREQAEAVASQVTESAAQAAGAAKDAAAKAQESVQAATAKVMPAQETTQEGAEDASAETDVATEAPSVKETVQAELSDVGEKVEAIQAEATAPPDQAEKSAGESFGTGTTNATEMHTAMAPTSRPEAATATAPAEEQAQDGQGTRPIAGEGTTTATGGTVDALSPTPQGGASTGTAEPLPAGLTPGEPGTGGPQASSQAPSTPDSAATPTTGKEQPPEIDRTADVLERTSGNFIGNKKTRVFHAASAGNLPGEDNRVYFESEEEAVAAGFRPAEREGLDSAES